MKPFPVLSAGWSHEPGESGDGDLAVPDLSAPQDQLDEHRSPGQHSPVPSDHPQLWRPWGLGHQPPPQLLRWWCRWQREAWWCEDPTKRHPRPQVEWWPCLGFRKLGNEGASSCSWSVRVYMFAHVFETSSFLYMCLKWCVCVCVFYKIYMFSWWFEVCFSYRESLDDVWVLLGRSDIFQFHVWMFYKLILFWSTVLIVSEERVALSSAIAAQNCMADFNQIIQYE